MFYLDIPNTKCAVPGQLDIDICRLGVDYYTGNLHKWCYVPPAVAFLWVASPKNLKAMHYPVISHAYNLGLLKETSFVGTRDYSLRQSSFTEPWVARAQRWQVGVRLHLSTRTD